MREQIVSVGLSKNHNRTNGVSGSQEPADNWNARGRSPLWPPLLVDKRLGPDTSFMTQDLQLLQGNRPQNTTAIIGIEPVRMIYRLRRLDLSDVHRSAEEIGKQLVGRLPFVSLVRLSQRSVRDNNSLPNQLLDSLFRIRPCPIRSVRV